MSRPDGFGKTVNATLLISYSDDECEKYKSPFFATATELNVLHARGF